MMMKPSSSSRPGVYFPRPGLTALKWVIVAAALLAAALALIVHVRAKQTAGGFPAEEAREAAALSRAIYFGGGGTVVDDAATGARVAFTHRPESARLYVVFCGTDGAVDAAHALDVTPVETDLGVITRRGFYTQFGAVRGAVERAVRGVPQETEVVFCGHSMGAALAAIAVLHLGDALEGLRVMCLMFNCPLVGDARFREAFDRACTRAWHFTSLRDPMTIASYNHIGKTVYIDPFLRVTYVGERALPLWYRLRPPDMLDAAHHLFIEVPAGSKQV